VLVLSAPRTESVRVKVPATVSGGGGEFTREAAVSQEDHPVGVCGGHRVVRYHHDGLAEVRDRVAQELQQAARGPLVKVAGRLVGVDNLRAAGQGPHRSYPLLLTAGQLGRGVAQPSAQPDDAGQVIDPGLVRILAANAGRQRDVVERGEGGQQVEVLEDEPDALPAQERQPLVTERTEVGLAEEHPFRPPTATAAIWRFKGARATRKGPSACWLVCSTTRRTRRSAYVDMVRPVIGNDTGRPVCSVSGRTTVMSVVAKSLPVHSTGCPVRSASA
jgi:hypothetical protein